MLEEQLDLFADAGVRIAVTPRPTACPSPADLDDSALIAALADAGIAAAVALAAEAAQRRLAAGVPALEALCRRFAGFGRDRVVPEQVAALEALAAIGGGEAANAVARAIARGLVQGPGLVVALEAAQRLRARLTADVVRPLLRHALPAVRARACRCALGHPTLASDIAALLGDGDRDVALAAACALGQMGRREARPLLLRLLRTSPSPERIEAAAAVADEDCVVLLGRIARTVPGLAAAALAALDDSAHPRAPVVAAMVRREASNAKGSSARMVEASEPAAVEYPGGLRQILSPGG